ncbi:AlpA family phage regulatory protein [Lysobacter sp. GX 14042]|uniref:helix-turn-helix transcriptional regulator n=1 Tax=Lysobacter sp. GX 14042 TaxID=2907155 RepID=UPI001F169AFE|nr:AlpA family phage regulatory protein [Lysobacter sp. GX 14042]MCE7031727.1 AlpA family phage regulatory protein [Lysobacter sp. GX 14042]
MSTPQVAAIPGIADPILRKRQVLQATGLTSSTLDRLERGGDFPRKLQIAPRAVGWLASEVDAWIRRKAAEAQAA